MTILFYLKKHSSSLSLNDLNRLEPRGCKLIRLTGRVIQVSDEADKQLGNFSASEISTLRNSSISLSTVVLNSRDWYRKLYDFGKISHFKNQPCNRLYPKKPAGMHW